jgi:hypothetical protein
LERPRENKGGEETVADGEEMATCATEEEVAGVLGLSIGGGAVPAGLGVSLGRGARGGEATGEGETLGILTPSHQFRSCQAGSYAVTLFTLNLNLVGLFQLQTSKMTFSKFFF